MKSISMVTIAGLLCLGGCSTLATNPAPARLVPPQPVAVVTEDADGSQRRPPPLPAVVQPENQLAPTRLLPEAPPATEPDAVVKLDPKSGIFTPEMEARLARIAGEVTKDDRLLIRLESYVPSGGSPALDIGLADNVLRKVRERLLAQGVPSRRMLLSSFGAEHGMERDLHRHWVEIYVVRPGYSSGHP